MKTHTLSESVPGAVPISAIRTEGLVLAERGKPASYAIVVPRGASETLRYAAATEPPVCGGRPVHAIWLDRIEFTRVRGRGYSPASSLSRR